MIPVHRDELFRLCDYIKGFMDVVNEINRDDLTDGAILDSLDELDAQVRSKNNLFGTLAVPKIVLPNFSIFLKFCKRVSLIFGNPATLDQREPKRERTNPKQL